ncbi:MAG: type II toxin-antitoxin system VapB family antitoxin [Methylobacter sp.]|jgi:Arc/MetJ family transcription regulator|nr:type II toxin-antitoxin system VapB family antitoxin [Methylobacter sp.]
MCIAYKFLTQGQPNANQYNLDDTLMADVLKATGVKSKREAVELGLKALLMLKQQEGIKAFKGKLKWEGDLERMRTDR